MNLYSDVPQLLVGFDVESTGLDTYNDEAISYGFAEFVNGQLVVQDEFFVLPDIQIHPGAERVHGISYEKLRRLYREGDALSARAGATRATSRLLEYRERGATFVGANPMFDYTMLDSTLRRQGHGGLIAAGFDVATLSLIDVVAHDLAIEPERTRRPRRGLAYLCEHYDVTPGRHEAGGDARASAEVLLAQIARVQRAHREIVERTAIRAHGVHPLVNWARSLFR